MSRNRTPIGELGTINFGRAEAGWEARARVRRADGTSYRPRARGKTKALAEEALRTRVEQDTRRASTGMESDPTLATLCDLWDQRILERSKKTESTKATYRQHLSRIKAVAGQMRVSEAKVMRLEDVLFNGSVCPPSQARQRLKLSP